MEPEAGMETYEATMEAEARGEPSMKARSEAPVEASTKAPMKAASEASTSVETSPAPATRRSRER
jgi:hypothetical protein